MEIQEQSQVEPETNVIANQEPEIPAATTLQIVSKCYCIVIFKTACLLIFSKIM